MSEVSAAAVALLLPPRAPPDLVVAGLGLAERWRRGLSLHKVETRAIEPVALPAELGAATTPVLVADGGAVSEAFAITRMALARCAPDEVVVFTDEAGRDAPALLLGAQAAHRLAEHAADVPRLRQVAREGGAVRSHPLHALTFDEPASKREADEITRAMLRRMRLRPGGLIARHVNRHLSVRLTRFILKTPLDPNAITTITGLLALVACAVIAQPGMLAAIVGASLMQLSSVLDGCDGEVARVRYQQSEFGRFYDSAWDEVVNALFLVAIGRHLALDLNAPWLAGAGAFAGTVGFLYGAANFHCKWIYGVGLYWWFDGPPAPVPPDQPPARPTWRAEIKTLFGRDAYLFALWLVALAGPWPLAGGLVVMTGSAAVFLVLLVIHVGVVRARW